METDKLHGKDSANAPCTCFLKHVTLISRMWGLFTLIMVWASAVIVIQDKKGATYVGWYLVAVGILLVFLELIWIVGKSACCGTAGCCCRCFTILLWLDNWKKGVLYIALSIPVFLESMRIILGVISGFFLITLGLLYIVKTFQYGQIHTREERRYVETSTPVVQTVAHEISTQTTDETYYQEISKTEKTEKNPFESVDK
ncbi:uncharacterized protein LOC121371571 [Gigantopelta aegis]|uniref:uncharacterized protein LOC121371571 n=1 Tax=Gigantopelta aegis TaxID=1735272 RepID=UPI001B88C948|nr:uncharacterized protein LOC121371571 [Gigantopelta aegis]